MDDDCVAEDEMRWIGSSGQPVDPIDAVLDGTRDGDDGDLLAVAAIVHDLVAAYDRREPLDVRPELAAFCGSHRAVAIDGGPGTRRPPMRRVAGFAATVGGKVLLTAAVASAGVVGVHAAGVDVPVLPDRDRPVARADPADSNQAPDTPDREAGAVDGETTTSEADADRAAVEAYTSAVDDWTDCVADAAAARGDEATRTTGRFDPDAVCGAHPEPGDFGLGELPDQAADPAGDARGGASSAGTAPGATAPGSTAPGATAPGATAPGATAPGATAPGATAPRAGGPSGSARSEDSSDAAGPTSGGAANDRSGNPRGAGAGRPD